MEEEEDVSLDLLLVICLGPLAVVLLVSYVVHWYQVRLLYLHTSASNVSPPQVIQRVERNRHRHRRHEGGAGGGGAGHTKAAPMLSIRTLENQRCRISASNRSIGSTTGFHNHGESPY